MARTIRVDDEVFAKLQGLAEPLVDTPNSVLRRLLDLEADAPTARSPRHDQAEVGERQYGLLPYLKDGRLVAGQTLVWKRRNLGQEHRAEVLANGNLRVHGGRVYGTPSRAATDLAGNQQNGLVAWHTEDGRRLSDL